MFPLKSKSVECVALLNQDTSLYVAVPLILNPRLCVADYCNMAKQFKPLVLVLLIECDKGLDDVSLFEMRVLLSVVGETGLEMGYVQMLPF